MEEAARKSYLKAMGVQAYRLREQSIEEIPEEKGSVPVPEEANIPTDAVKAEKGTDPFSAAAPPSPDDDLHAYMQMDQGSPDEQSYDPDDLIELPEIEPISAPGVSTLSWQELQDRIIACKQCELCDSRTNTVFGVGNPDADVMVIGEAPGADEDARGEPFVGVAGKLLDNMLKAIALDRKKVFIANILKCRPPSNRNPSPEEINSCEAYLNRQIELIQPKLILSVGGVSAKNLLKSDEAVGRLRLQKQQLIGKNIPVQVTYHPAYLLRKPSEKAKAWVDLKRLKQAMIDLGI